MFSKFSVFGGLADVARLVNLVRFAVNAMCLFIYMYSVLGHRMSSTFRPSL